MMVVGQHFGHVKSAEREHRTAIGQAISLVGPRLEECESVVEVSTCLGKDVNGLVVSQVANLRNSRTTPVWSVTAPKVQYFSENLVSRDNTRGAQCLTVTHYGTVESVARIEQGYPVKRIRK